MNEIDEILKKYDWPKKEIIENLNFGEIESKIGFELSKDYKTYLQNYSSYETEIGEQFFNLWDFANLLNYNEDYEIFENLKMTIAIGSNGGGEFIGLEKLVDGKIRVVLSPFIDLDKEYHIEIGNSFTDFLKRMDNGEKWFKENEPK
ncbi:MAG: SMI1/KNR4 family protein [Flavobacterium sp.]|uniref:SMI1/KNR4 family protein n=1 Tax=Flavobacterium sp. TaxID=239 RepID=UPI003263094C